MTGWLVIWPQVTRLPDGSYSAATPYGTDEARAREAAVKGNGTLIRLPLGAP